jgi:hypothetical protein
MRTGPDLTDAGDGFARLNLNSVNLAATMAAVQQARAHAPGPTHAAARHT